MMVIGVTFDSPQIEVALNVTPILPIAALIVCGGAYMFVHIFRLAFTLT